MSTTPEAQQALKKRGCLPRRDIGVRAEAFAVQAIRLYQHLTSEPDRAGWVVGKQFVRAATSIGANIEEAQDASSRRDFAHRYSIALREAREARYWLRLMIQTDLAEHERARVLLDEAGEIYAILNAIVRRARQPLA